MSALEVVVDEGLHASLNTGNVVSHGVHASLGGVDLDDVLQLSLAALELLLPELALGLAILNQQVFWVLTFLQHLLHIAYRGLALSIKRNIKAQERLTEWLGIYYLVWQCGARALARVKSSQGLTSLQHLLPSFTSNAFI